MVLHRHIQVWKQGVMAPIEQARRCLDIWLREEGRHMPERARQRTAALLARYFHYEDEVTDTLLLSFLRHYSGHHAIDMDDMTAVKSEIKELLDKSAIVRELRRSWLTTAGMMALTAAAFLIWQAAHWKITPAQQTELKRKVTIVAAAQATPAASVWADIKRPLKIRRYQDMSYWDYKEAQALIDRRLAGAGM